ncbi:MAG: hypothetical protein ACTSWG_13365 [Candidatus Helarchaeota archaeon]
MNITRKVWGIKHRILETSNTEIDLLYLEKNSACSVHYHNKKFNRFILLKGNVSIKSDLGETKLQINQPFDVEPPLTHQFVIHEDSVMIELAFVKNGKINSNDIIRNLQGGKFIKGKFYTLNQLKNKNWLHL